MEKDFGRSTGKDLVLYTIVALIGSIATVGIIYLTPLKYVGMATPTMREMSPSEFYEGFQKNPEAFLFVDVRSAEAYTKEHATGSISIPLATLHDVRATLPRTGKTIALICGSNSASSVAYGYLEHYGFSNLIHITGGIVAWKLAELPTEGAAVSTTTQLSSVACLLASKT